MKKILFPFLILVSMLSCSDDETSDTGDITFEFDARAGEEDFAFGTTYQNELGQDFKLNSLTYSIINVRLRTVDGDFVEDPAQGTYSIDDSEEASTLITLHNIPKGDYDAVEITIGGEGTYLEASGTSPESTETGNALLYVLSGTANYRIKLVEFDDHVAEIKHSAEPEVHLIVDVLNLFTGTVSIDFSEMPVCEEVLCGASIADNYLWTFEFDHIHQ